MNSQLFDQPSVSAFIVQTFQKNLADINIETDGVKANQDIEFVHRQRIAIRRLRNNLQIFRHYGNEPFKTFLLDLQNRMCPLAFALANARDLDILLSLSAQLFLDVKIQGEDKFVDTLHETRYAQQQTLADRLNELDDTQVFVTFLRDLPVHLSKSLFLDDEILCNLPARTICSLSSQALAQNYLLNAQSGFIELHQFRKIIRRIRYTLECYSTQFSFDLQFAIESAHQIQDQLGYLHDLDMLQLSIKQYLPMLSTLDTQLLDQIIQAARLPQHAAFINASQTGELMSYLQNLLNIFHQQLLVQTEN